MDNQMQHALAQARINAIKYMEGVPRPNTAIVPMRPVTLNEATTRLQQAIQEFFHILVQPFIELGRQIKRVFTGLFNRLRIRAGFSTVKFVRGRYQLVNSRFLLKRVKVVHAKPKARKRR